MLHKLLAVPVFTVLLIGCQVPQSGWNVKDAVDSVGSENQGKCYFDGFDVICLVPGPKGEPGKDGRDGRDGRNGKDGRDGKTIITRYYSFSHPDAEEPFTTEVTVELPSAAQETGSPDPGGADPDPETAEVTVELPPVAQETGASDPEVVDPDPETEAPDSEVVDEIEVIKVIPSPPTRPKQPIKVRCGGNTCHVEIRSGTPWLIEVVSELGKPRRYEQPLSDETYEAWLKFVKRLQEVGFENYNELWK